MACVNDGREITEEDYSVLCEVHRIMKEGRLPFYKVVCTDSPVKTTEGTLFSDNTTDTIQGYPDGTQFVYTQKNSKH
jgi:hypothetical protein